MPKFVPSFGRPWAARFEDNGSTLVNEDGLRLARKIYRPKGMVKALVYFAHGYIEHFDRNKELFEPLNEKGFLVFGHNHSGHGDSEGEPRFIEDFNIYVRDVIADIQLTRVQYPDKPIYLIGVSMGGCIATLTASSIQDKLAGLVLIAPAIAHDPQTASDCKIAMAYKLARIWPKFGVGSIPRRFLSRNEDTIDAIRHDPLMTEGKATAKWGVEMFDAMKEAQIECQKITLPMFVVAAGEDKVCNNEGVEILMNGVQSEDKTSITYPGMYHDVIHELPEDSAKVIGDIVEWVAAHSEDREPVLSSNGKATVDTSDNGTAEEGVKEVAPTVSDDKLETQEEVKKEEVKEEEAKEEEVKEEEAKAEEAKKEEVKEEEAKKEEVKEEEAKEEEAKEEVKEEEAKEEEVKEEEVKEEEANKEEANKEEVAATPPEEDDEPEQEQKEVEKPAKKASIVAEV